MIKTNILRYAAIGMVSVGLAGAAAASTVSFDGATTGPDSSAKVNLTNTVKHTTNNLNGVGVANLSSQGAGSGDVNAAKNTEVGGANGSGDAKNTNDTNTNVVITNGGGGAAASALAGMGAGDTVSFDNAVTGPDSKVNVSVKNTETTKVNNTNIVQVENVNEQTAVSGNVSAYKNTKVGGLTSGDASNTNHTVNSVVIGN